MGHTNKRFTVLCRLVDSTLTVRKSRTETHVRHLLALTSQFPRVNPSAVAQGHEGADDTQLDVTQLLSKIRARYKALCATVGVKPRLHDAGSSSAVGVEEGLDVLPEAQPRKKGAIWRLDANPAPANSEDMSF